VGNRLPPIVGNWYAHRDKGALFQVVALDEDAGTVEIQEFDGGLDELDLDEWRTLLVDSAAQPEDWGGPLGEVHHELHIEALPLEIPVEQIVEDDDFDEPIH